MIGTHIAIWVAIPTGRSGVVFWLKNLKILSFKSMAVIVNYFCVNLYNCLKFTLNPILRKWELK